MEQHPIPRQITTFEFKLVGFLTIKQFLYLLVFVGLGFIVYAIFPVPILNVFFGIVVGAIGAAFAFVPINDRPLDVWLKNLLKRLTSPTQYQYHKHNDAPSYLVNMTVQANPALVNNHIDSQKKLNNYLGKNVTQTGTPSKKQSINNLFQIPTPNPTSRPSVEAKKAATSMPSPSVKPKEHFFSGLVKNYKNIPLYGILIYVRQDEKGEPKRILKTNVNGVFATFSPLPAGTYFFEIKDPQGKHFFDTMKVEIKDVNPHPIEVVSKEMI